MSRIFVLLGGLVLAACMQVLDVELTQSAPQVTTITITPSPDGLNAHWQLPQPTASFDFIDGSMPPNQRADEWAWAQDEWVFDGMTLSRLDGEPFDTFAFTLTPATQFYDRKYVPVAKVGPSGWVILSAALAPQGADHQIRLSGFGADTVIYANGRRFDTDATLWGSDAGIVYVGPGDQVTTGAATIIAGSNVPAWLAQQLTVDLETASQKLASRFGRTPETPPTLLMTYEEDWQSRSHKGGVNRDVITLHLRGFVLDDRDESLTQSLMNTAIHESVHVWNGTMFHSSENAEQAWVHEGGAEYIANRLWIDDTQMQARAQRAFNTCRISLGNVSLMETQSASRGRTPYHCGHLVHLIAERAALQAGRGDILDIWNAVFDTASGLDNTYDSAIFLDTVDQFGGAAATAPIQRLIDGLSVEELPDFLSELNAIGIELTPLEDTSGDASLGSFSGLVLQRLLLGYCTGGHGYWSQATHFKLNTGDHCGDILGGDPEISHLNGHSVIDAPVAVYQSAVQSCADGTSLILSRLDGTDLQPLSCPAPVMALPPLYAIAKLGELPPL